MMGQNRLDLKEANANVIAYLKKIYPSKNFVLRYTNETFMLARFFTCQNKIFQKITFLSTKDYCLLLQKSLSNKERLVKGITINHQNKTIIYNFVSINNSRTLKR